MSNKIDGGIGSTPRVLSNPASGVERAGNERSQPVGPTPPPDQVRLTPEATALQALQRTIADGPVVDMKKVEAVKAALEKGSYQIDPEAIATGMLRMERDLG
ncbi:MAG: flagellar biosynthesis anti-sigma factor FlgM [Lysobacteraceae bacterium]